MKKFLTTLVILILMLTAGMTLLVSWINPNDFRHAMVQQIERYSGYKLVLEGSMRWHIWPRPSILTERVALFTPGASQPVVSADNMRLDVRLWPLLSRRLSVRQIMVKGAIFRLMPESFDQRTPPPVAAPAGNASSGLPADIPAIFEGVDQLTIADSVVIWQEKKRQINVRDLDAQLNRNGQFIQIALAARINRDQKTLSLSLRGQAEPGDYLQQLRLNVQRLTYHLNRIGDSGAALSGEAQGKVFWQRQDPNFFVVSDLRLLANGQRWQGNILGKWDPGEALPQFDATLSTPVLDLDAHGEADKAADNAAAPPPLLARMAGLTFSADPGQPATVSTPSPFVQGKLRLNMDKVVWRGLTFSPMTLQLATEGRTIHIREWQGRSGDATFSLPGEIRWDGATPQVTLYPVVSRFPAQAFFRLTGLPASFNGEINLQGTLRGQRLMALFPYDPAWQAQLRLALRHVTFPNLNLQQLVQQALPVPQTAPEMLPDSELDQLTAEITAAEGRLQLRQLNGTAVQLSVTGDGFIDLPARQTRLNLQVRLKRDPTQKVSALQAVLADTPVPLKIEGRWGELHYAVELPMELRKQFRQILQKQLEKWQS